MARYKLLFKKSVAKDLRSLPKSAVRKILARLNTLADEPRAVGCKKLSDQEFYRVRQGVYRIIYEIIDDQLVVHRASPSETRADHWDKSTRHQ